jgi:lipopolysaccharide transport system ATP-binding protein
MAAVKRLCPRSVLMERGTVTFDGPTDAVVERYMARGGEAQRVLNWPAGEAPANDELRLETIAIVDSRGRTDGALSTEDPIELVIGYTLLRELRNLRIGATLTNSDGIDILSTSDFKYQPETKKRPAGQYRSRCRIPAGLLNTGVYSVQVDFEIPFERKVLESLTLAFEISELSRNELGPTHALRPRGVVHPILPWTVEHLENVVAPARLNAASE